MTDRPRRVSSKEGFAGQESTLRLANQHLTAAIAELENFPDMDTGEGDSACCNLRQAVECISESLGDMDGPPTRVTCQVCLTSTKDSTQYQCDVCERCDG